MIGCHFLHDEIILLGNVIIDELRIKYEARRNGYGAQVEGDKLVIGDFGEPPEITNETKVLHDGDIVEVDANRGIVTILK